MGKAKRPTRASHSASRSEKHEEKRERRSFSAEFKLEAVQVMRNRRAKGVSLEQIGRELDVRPNLLHSRQPRGLHGKSGSRARCRALWLFPAGASGTSEETV